MQSDVSTIASGLRRRIAVSEPSIPRAEALALLEDCLDRNWVTKGPMVARFEDFLRGVTGAEYAIACSSGTAALHLAMLAVGIGPGNEVIVPDMTYVATANAVRYVGAKPVLVDVDPLSWNIDPFDVARHITAATRAVVPVDLFGEPADIDTIRRAAGHVVIIDDASEALGAKYKDGVMVGGAANLTTFSFYGNKIITTGEGGAVVTNDGIWAGRVRHYLGQAVKPDDNYFHLDVGYNYRMTDLQAAVGLAQAPHLSELIAKRNALAMHYDKCLPDWTTQQLPQSIASTPSDWMVGVLFEHAASAKHVRTWLAEAGVETRPFFTPLHLLPMYRDADERFPVATDLWQRGVMLPTHSNMSLEDVEDICEVIRAA